MATFSLETFRDAIGAGSRPNLFLVKVTPPSVPGVNLQGFEYVCRAASLPGSTMGLIEIPMNGGRRLKIAGDRTFPEWTTTVLNDENFLIRSQFELWQNNIVKTNYNLSTVGDRRIGIGEPIDATGARNDTSGLTNGIVEVYQLDSSGQSVRKAEKKLLNCWPSDISTIDLSYDTTDTVEEFTVTWTYDYWVNQSNAEIS